MPPEDAFEDLILRVREGDEAAAEEIVRRHEDQVRRVVRRALKDPRVCGVYDSGDIAQSVLALFFAGARSGDFDLSKPENLSRLLTTMARNRLIDKVRGEDAEKRKSGKKRPLDDRVGKPIEIGAPGPSPSEEAMNRELIEEARRRLSDEEKHLVDQRALGLSWQEIGKALGEAPDAARMRLSRALARVAAEIDTGRSSGG